VNPNGDAIALGHPLGMSGARLVAAAMCRLQRTGGRFALCTVCIGVGQGIALAIERVGARAQTYRAVSVRSPPPRSMHFWR
jgi:acetyl-CoA acetyltransferase